MLKAIWNNLAEDGMGLVTVPSLEYILEKGSYYELIRDHIAYYTFDTLRALLNHCGFAGAGGGDDQPGYPVHGCEKDGNAGGTAGCGCRNAVKDCAGRCRHHRASDGRL